MQTLIESSVIGGPARSYHFTREDLAGNRRTLPAFTSTGKPLKMRFAGEFEWRRLVVHRANIIEVGEPKLTEGWQARAEAVREEIIRACNPLTK